VNQHRQVDGSSLVHQADSGCPVSWCVNSGLASESILNTELTRFRWGSVATKRGNMLLMALVGP